MAFTYYELKSSAENGTRLGKWKGLSVFACSKAQMKDKGTGAYYIIYDDDNALVRRVDDSGKIRQYGAVDAYGNVDEWKVSRVYGEEVREAAVPVASGKQDEPTVDVDFRMNTDVNEVLKCAREMTLDDLLAGFDYGLEEAKG